MHVDDVAAPSTAIVTGAAGWLGQNLVRALAPERNHVRALVFDDADAPLVELAGANVDVVVGDVRDPTVVDRLFDGDAGMGATVFHTAAVIHPAGRVRALFDVNVGGTQLVLDRARRANANRFVHVSSNSPFGVNRRPTDRFTEASPPDPYLAYGRSKLEAETLVRRAGRRGDLETVIIRSPWFYGPFQPERQTRWFRAVRRGRFPLVGDGRNRRSMVYTGHLVHGLLRAEAEAAAAGRAYWIADPEPYEMRTVLATVRTALAAEGLAVSGGQPRLPRIAARMAQMTDAKAQALGRYVQPVHVLGDLVETIACDVSRARIELGYAPGVTLYDGMRASIRWCLERGHAL
ncbi:MAG: NAD-dependent epimerase/dehydratase family protein [Acidimicrobiales bacterium]